MYLNESVDEGQAVEDPRDICLERILQNKDCYYCPNIQFLNSLIEKSEEFTYQIQIKKFNGNPFIHAKYIPDSFIKDDVSNHLKFMTIVSDESLKSNIIFRLNLVEGDFGKMIVLDLEPGFGMLSGLSLSKEEVFMLMEKIRLKDYEMKSLYSSHYEE